MRFKRLFFLVLCFMAAYSLCHAKDIIVVSVKGASQKTIHEVVHDESRKFGYHLREGFNYLKYETSLYVDSVQALHLRDKIISLARRDGRVISNLSLLLVGKSLGAIRVWNLLRLHYDSLDDFHRIALVLVDPHGAAADDGNSGAYKDSQDLWWPDNWSSDSDFFRVYHIYQHETGTTGANFPDSRVHWSRQLSGTGICHSSITGHQSTRLMIRSALSFTCLSRVGTVSNPFNIVIENVRGRSTVNGRDPIEFHVENFNCNCFADVQVIKDDRDGMLLRTIRNLSEGESASFRSSTRKQRLTFRALSCGGQESEQTVHLDYDPPTFSGIGRTTSSEGSTRSTSLYAQGVIDDGYWNDTDYGVCLILNDNWIPFFNDSGRAITLNNLEPGTYDATMWIKDGFDRWSSSISEPFTVPAGPPTLSFVSPGSNASVRRSSNMNITIEAGAEGGIMKVNVYLDQVSEDEFNPTRLCYFHGPFGANGTERKTCTVRADWSTGRHTLIAVAKDYSGQTRRVQRTFQVD